MAKFSFPAEGAQHEGTWLIWPHEYTYGKNYRDEIEHIWIQMVSALHHGENIHIVAYSEKDSLRIVNILTRAGVNMSKVDFTLARSDDVWVRDTGPMFVRDRNGMPVIVDFTFDGWGGKAPCALDDRLPQRVAKAKNIPIVSITGFVLEGGAVELDGSGTAMLCKSSTVSKNRNPQLSIAQAEAFLSQYFGVDNFIWLEGVLDEDITDSHIDGTARFYDDKTLLTVSEDDFIQMYNPHDYAILRSAVNAYGKQYSIHTLPITAQNVRGLDYKGSYTNYYVGNNAILLPVYNDINDAIAIEIFQELYTNKTIVPIDVTPLYKYGGMLHCVTQQQPGLYGA